MCRVQGAKDVFQVFRVKLAERVSSRGCRYLIDLPVRSFGDEGWMSFGHPGVWLHSEVKRLVDIFNLNPGALTFE